MNQSDSVSFIDDEKIYYKLTPYKIHILIWLIMCIIINFKVEQQDLTFIDLIFKLFLVCIKLQLKIVCIKYIFFLILKIDIIYGL